MLRSMTAYGRATLASQLGRFAVEIQSVNRKFLEVNISLSKELLPFEIEFKKWIAAAVSRGHVNVKVAAVLDSATPQLVYPNIALAKQIKAAWDEIAHALEITQDKGFTLQFLAEEEGILTFSEDIQTQESYRQPLKEVFDEALTRFLEMKDVEGKALQNDILTRVRNLRNQINTIATYAPSAVQKFEQKLKEKLEQVLPGCVENEERLLREIVLYAEKVDIAEEITRFNSHLEQFETVLNSSDISIGKKLEFLLQELHREINTIGSKSSDVAASKCVVEVKGELERIREQIQNVE